MSGDISPVSVKAGRRREPVNQPPPGAQAAASPRRCAALRHCRETTDGVANRLFAAAPWFRGLPPSWLLPKRVKSVAQAQVDVVCAVDVSGVW